ncbi:MAG: efflux RND transporter periplasmic adaptor subunit [Pseudomonadota bacterium]
MRLLTRARLPLLALLLLGLSIVYANGSLSSAESTSNQPQAAPLAVIPEARVMTLRPAAQSGSLTAFGQARARFEVTLAAQVSGRVITVATEADSGFQVSDEQVLVEVEDVPYRMAVADAERALADAELALLQEQRLAERARAEWRTADFADEPSDLAFRVPQLKAANAAIRSATTALENAQNNLRLTRIAAPFPAIVVQRLVSPGDIVQQGTPLLRVASVDRAEVRVPLSAQQWQSIQPRAGASVTVFGPDSVQRWPGYVLRLEQHMGGDDRQRAVVVAVDDPLGSEAPLLSGAFVSVQLPTKVLADAYRLPATALSAEGLLWCVDENSRLAAFRPATTVNLNDEILAVPPEPLGEVAFLVRPLANLTVGSEVRSVEANPLLIGTRSP